MVGDINRVTFRSQTTGALYAWELEHGRRNRRVPVRGGVVSSDGRLTASLAQQGVGFVYAFEPMVLEQLQAGTLVRVLERHAPTVPGFFPHFPSVAWRSAPLRLFVEAAKELPCVERVDGRDVRGHHAQPTTIDSSNGTQTSATP